MHPSNTPATAPASAPNAKPPAAVCIERGADFTRLKTETAPRRAVPNDFPSEEQAVLAAYDYARSLIDEGRV
jgi:hypothetical protein